MTAETDKFKHILRDNHVSVTSARLAIFNTLLKADRLLRNSEIAVRTPSVNRASVYRALELFAKLGVTTTVIRGWTPYVELAEPFRAHHHHLVCETCGCMVDIDSEKLERMLGQIANSHGFILRSHVVELTGVCGACRLAKTKMHGAKPVGLPL